MGWGDGPQISPEPISVLRWIYSNKAERLECELALDANRMFYEFRTRCPVTRSSASIERFGDVGRAFQRQSEFEATLIADGWSLEDYQRLTAYR